MKKNLLFVAAFAMAMASCSNDEVMEMTQSNSISFRSSLENVSRAVTTAGNLTSFQVYSYEGSTEYFTDVVTPNDEKTIWNTQNGTYYWPIGNTLSFFGYAPTSLRPTINSTSLSIDNYTVNGSDDFLVAYTKEAIGPNSVPMNFRHALSQIVIQAKNSSSIYTVEITGVKIANIKNKATFTFKPNESTSTQDSPLDASVWDEYSNQLESYSRSYNVSLAPNASATSLINDNPFLLLPQQLTDATFQDGETGSYISVTCKIYKENGANDVVIFPSEEGYAETAVAINTKWEPGKKYIYTLNFMGDSDSAGGGKNPETGEEILKPITFTVSVDDWTPETEIGKNMGD